MKKVLVIGLGRFGKSVLKELHELGHDVVGCDEDMETFDEIENFAEYLVEGDCTDQSILDELNILDFNHVIVSIGDNFEAAILTVTKLKNLGCESIISKANDKLRAQALFAVGAHQVILPEEDAGRRLANKIGTPGFLEIVDLGPHFSGVEIEVPKEFIGKSILDINIRKKFNVNIISVKKNDTDKPIIPPDPNDLLSKGDELFLIGEVKQLQKIINKYQK